MPQNTVRVAFVGRLKNAALSEFLVRKRWSQTRLAMELRVSLGTVNRWVLLKEAPRKEEILRKLEELLGELREDIFPEFFRSKEWKEVQEQASGEHMVIREVPVQVILRSGRLSLPSPEVDYDKKELYRVLEEALDILTVKQKKILQLHFGLGDEEEHTLKEVGEMFGVSGTRIRDIEAQAMHDLKKHPSHAKRLRPFLEK